MSALFDATTKYLTASLGAEAPIPDDLKLVTLWVYWASGATAGSNNYAFSLINSDLSFLRAGVEANKKPRILCKPGGTQNNLDINQVLTDDTWYLLAGYTEGDDGTTSNNEAFLDGTSGQTGTVATGNTDTANFTDMSIGNLYTGGSSEWQGRIADVAIWTPASQSSAQTIVSQIWNSGSSKTADNIAEDTPIWYADLESDATVTIGTSLTNNGSVTFSSGTHPSLTGPGAASSEPTGGTGRGVMRGIGRGI